MWDEYEKNIPLEKLQIQFENNKLATEIINIEIISATKYSKADFWEKSALGLSLRRHLKQDKRLSVKVAFDNARGLSEIFNQCIEQADDNAVLVFIHDDVWIDEANFTDAVVKGLEQFDVIGIAGNKRRVPNQPAWSFIDLKLTWDEPVNLSGRIAYGENAFGIDMEFGEVPAECELLDGVFFAVKNSDLMAKKVRFDSQFDFHFYDMDFCRTARQAGLKLGTWPLKLTHQSGGAFGTPHWAEKCQYYFNKWESETASHLALQDAIRDVLNDALAHQQAGRIEQAELLYQEILKIQPNHAEANHNLGVLEVESKGVLEALPRFEQAVQAQPEQEQFWVSYIDALMKTGAIDAAVSALEFGQQFGLHAETAQMLAAEFVKEFDASVEPLQSMESMQASALEAMQVELKVSSKNQEKRIGVLTKPVFYVWAPPYTELSSGGKALHLLCDGLNKLGYEAYVTQTVVNKELITPGATSDLINQHKEDNRLQIAIYPEIEMGNPLLVPNVVRYLLNKPNFFLKTSWFGCFHKDEYVLHYDKGFTIPWVKSEELYVPTMNRNIFRYDMHDQKPRNGFLVYSNRVIPDLEMIPDWCKPYQVISMKTPKSHIAMSELYKQSLGLITFENTAALAEAVLCGCPVIASTFYGFKPNECLERISEISWNFDRAAFVKSQNSAGSFGPIYDAENKGYMLTLKVVAEKMITYFELNESDPVETTPAYALEIAKKYVQRADVKNAILIYRQLILDQPTNPEAYYRMGEILAKIDILGSGLDVLMKGEQHLKMLPKHDCLKVVRKMYYEKLAAVCYALGDVELSNQYIEKERLNT
jgi:tetratricopeptide (TPR) repeat protein